MTTLAEELNKYYSREGKKIVFNNKQSLNQLAISMWEMLGFKQIDASVLSRVINGGRLFTSEQLEVFCRILNISDREKTTLKEALESDLLSRYGIEPEANYRLFEIYEHNYKQIINLRNRGMMNFIVDWTEISDFLEENIKVEKNEVIKK